MFSFSESILTKVLQELEGVPLSSYGRTRDAFVLTAAVPHWTSGFGGAYEMIHSNVPAGVRIAVGNLDDLDMSDFDIMKEQIANLDIYPFGHSGNFAGADVDALVKKFNKVSVLDNDVNGQQAISHASKLTPEGLGGRYNELVDYLSDHMCLFINKLDGGKLVPQEKTARSNIVMELLDGLSQTVRYTRIDEVKAVAYQFHAEGFIDKDGGGQIYFNLTDESDKMVVLITNKNGTTELRPLDKAMIGKTYVTIDGEEIGTRGRVDLSHIQTRGQEIEDKERIQSAPPFTYTVNAFAKQESRVLNTSGIAL